MSASDDIKQADVLREFRNLFGYTRASVQKAISQIESTDYGHMDEVMKRRAYELAGSLEIITEYMETY